MKTTGNTFKLILLCVALLNSFNTHAQKKNKKVKIYKVWVVLANKSKQKGFLYAVDDQSLKIIRDLSLENESEIIMIKAEDIYQIKIQRKGKMGRSILIGGLSGGLLASLGSSGTNDDDALVVQVYGEAAKAGSIVLGTLVGTSLGAIIGTGKKKFKISGDVAVFKSKQEDLSRCAIIKRSE
ncbi:hypothetical protein H7U19_02350 [Hyunsoonleella sp. SJ7]|uniref:Glycine zipper 2TM domain-containing protein n=1 Tax=Hyunsoonleella aquatilis TaxID=2762758 RepID=A0A923HBZ0_9FLAO|nr:hypothetical protein [Hyunsoonleella aquatilis]MBC3757228.1 hypothetical protein [Hyunsoonleella aquatilis]